MNRLKEFFVRVNWFAIASVLLLAGMVGLAWPTAPEAPYDWIITLGVAAIVAAVFSTRDDGGL